MEATIDLFQGTDICLILSEKEIKNTLQAKNLRVLLLDERGEDGKRVFSEWGVRISVVADMSITKERKVFVEYCYENDNWGNATTYRIIFSRGFVNDLLKKKKFISFVEFDNIDAGESTEESYIILRVIIGNEESKGYVNQPPFIDKRIVVQRP